ncbi:integrase SAM domain protein [Streptomyces sp. NPDC048508]|uniref:integrase SAM domain protein n=1 Tax=Streptomyces sp. NPDC048508 TaxID=3365561 RepID=UPI00371CB4C0
MAAAALDEFTWPAGGRGVLENRPVHAGTPASEMACFDEDLWPLTPAHPDVHIPAINLWWTTYPRTLVGAFKVFVLAALDCPHPVAMSGQRTHDQAGCGTVKLWFLRLRPFAIWLEDRGVGLLSEVGDLALDEYLENVQALSVSPNVKYQLLNAVRALWAYSEYLPAECQLDTVVPWQGRSLTVLAELPPPGRFNATPRIAAATMEALLDRSLRIVEDLGPDIRDAWREFRELSVGTHPDQQVYEGLAPKERVRLFVQQAARAGTVLPGTPGSRGSIAKFHLGRLIGVEPRRRTPDLGAAAAMYAEQLGVSVADDCYLGTITGAIDGRPWRERPITASELPLLVRVLVAACFVTINYLTGARPGETVGLRRGCRGTDEETGELLIRGRRGKGFDRTPLDPVDPMRPWGTVQPVHDAIAMLEALHDADLLFPTGMIKTNHRAERFAIGTNQANRDMERLLAWVNATFATGDGSLPIPPDPTKHLHGSRFRRTLAYFIVRRPRGLIAAALQYSHVSTKVTLSYAREGDTSWMEDLAVEKLEMVLEQNDEDWTLVQDGEHVSGPSAREYQARLSRSTSFSGRVVRSVRSVERLLNQVDPDIHHGEGMSCVHRAETAECRKEKLALGLPEDSGPDETFCRSSCTNLVYTDRDIAHQQGRIPLWDATATDPLSPRPRRDRAAALASQARTVIEEHEAACRRDGRCGGMTRQRRDRGAERTAIGAAAARLLAGTPLRSHTGKLTGTELITESGLRRDIVYGDHKDLVEEFQARAKAQSFTPDAIEKVAEQNHALKKELGLTKEALAAERERNAALVRVAAELSLELEQSRAELASAQQVSRLPIPRSPQPRQRRRR